MMIYYNSDENHFSIKNKGVINVFYLRQVNKLRLEKKRDLKLNIVLVCSAFACISIATYIIDLYAPILVVSYLCSILFFILSLNYQAYSYKIILVTNEPRTIEYTANILEIENIEHIVSKINKVLTKELDNTPSRAKMRGTPLLKQNTYDYER